MQLTFLFDRAYMTVRAANLLEVTLYALNDQW